MERRRREQCIFLKGNIVPQPHIQRDIHDIATKCRFVFINIPSLWKVTQSCSEFRFKTQMIYTVIKGNNLMQCICCIFKRRWKDFARLNFNTLWGFVCCERSKALLTKWIVITNLSSTSRWCSVPTNRALGCLELCSGGGNLVNLYFWVGSKHTVKTASLTRRRYSQSLHRAGISLSLFIFMD